MAEDTELDVDLEVVEEPKQANFPRRPNVVSHRGHTVKVTVSINEVPEVERKWATISAAVFTYGPEHLGPAAHASRSRKLWGMKPGSAFEIDPENLPVSLDVVVLKLPGDEHLGQGPYEAVITVNTSTAPPEDPAAVTEGDEFSIEFVSM